MTAAPSEECDVPRAGDDSTRTSALSEWLVLAWAIVWSWAYVQTALAERFPQWLSWTTRIW